MAQNQTKPKWPREVAVQWVWLVVLSAAIVLLIAHCDPSFLRYRLRVTHSWPHGCSGTQTRRCLLHIVPQPIRTCRHPPMTAPNPSFSWVSTPPFECIRNDARRQVRVLPVGHFSATTSSPSSIVRPTEKHERTACSTTLGYRWGRRPRRRTMLPPRMCPAT